MISVILHILIKAGIVREEPWNCQQAREIKGGKRWEFGCLRVRESGSDGGDGGDGGDGVWECGSGSFLDHECCSVPVILFVLVAGDCDFFVGTRILLCGRVILRRPVL